MRKLMLTAIGAVAVMSGVSAQNQSAIFVNGVQGSSDVPYNQALSAPPGGLTVEAWVTYDGSNLGSLNRFPTIVRATPLPGWSYFLRVNAGSTNIRQLRWAVRTQNLGVVTVNWDFNPGDLTCWTHVAATYDGLVSNLYVNGRLVGQTAGGGPITDGLGTIGIGEGRKDPVFHNEVWNGELDQVRIWSTPLSAAQIAAGMFSPLTSAPGLEGNWGLDGNLIDASGNGNNGVLFGSVAFQAATLPTQFEYQTNSAEASFDVNGVAPKAFCNAEVMASVGQLVNLNLDSTLVGNLFDLGITTPEQLVSASAGAILTGGAQLVNLNIGAPSLAFLFGGSLANPFVSPFTGPLTISVAGPAPLTAAGQMVILDPSQFDGFTLSAGMNLRVQ